MSSGSRGPSSGRYNDRSEYTEYGKSRRKNFYSPSTSRRDYKSGSGVQGAKDPAAPANGTRPYKGTSTTGGAPTSSTAAGTGTGTNVRDNRSYVSDQYASSQKGSSYGSYYPSYGSYNTFSSGGAPSSKSNDNSNYYNSRSDGWRSDRLKSTGGDSRLSSTNKPTYSSRINGASTNINPAASTTTNDYRKDRFDNYNHPETSSVNTNPKWKSASIASSPYNANKIPVSNNRGSLSGSVSRFSKDRIRSSFGGGGGSSALVNSGGGPKRSGDTYYPNSSPRDSFSSNYNTLKQERNSYSKPHRSEEFEDHKSRNTSVDPEEESSKSKEEGDHYSPNLSADEDDVENSRLSDDDDDSRIETKERTDELNSVERDDEDDEREDEPEEDEDNEIQEDIKKNDTTEIEVSKDNDVTVPTIEKVASPKAYVKVDVSNEVCYPDGCKYPQGHLEYQFELLEQEYLKDNAHANGDEYLKYSLAKPISDLYDYTFFADNFEQFVSRREKLVKKLRSDNLIISKKRSSLWREYSKGLKLWQAEGLKMDQQLRILHPADDEMRREIDSGDFKKQNQYYGSEAGSPDQQLPPNRRGRRHGDLVTTEAEFQEILQSLGKEDEEDPLVKAERVAATIPDLILDPVERDHVRFMDSNNIVVDKKSWSNRVRTDFVNNFSTKEHELFCEGFCFFPKRFGAISRHMGGLRTARDCVIHYYITKKAVNYKALLAQHKKKLTKKAGRRGKPPKSRNVSQSQTPLATPSDETTPILPDMAIEDKPEIAVPAISSDPFTEEIFTETGRRKRAAAPVFEGKPKKPDGTDDKLVQSAAGPAKKKVKKKSRSDISSEIPSGAVTAEEEIIEKPIEKELLDEGEPISNGAVMSTDPMRGNGSPTQPNFDIDTKERRKAISSYWSITEANLFPELLEEHGTKWTTIADKLTTKTATMVRNYFQRNAEKNGWNNIAQEADQRLEAKFAAVLSTKGDEKEGGEQGQTQTQTQAQPNLQHQIQEEQIYQNQIAYPPASVHVSQTPIGPYVPYGTFQHGAMPGMGMHQMAPVLPKMGPSISSLLSEVGPPTHYVPQEVGPRPPYATAQAPPPHIFTPPTQSYARPPQVQEQARLPPLAPQRSSIMSLLNSDSSPIKQEPQATTVSAAPSRQNKLHDLLNNSSEPYPAPAPPTSNGHKPNGIASLLSSTPTPYTNGANDQNTN